MTAAQQKRARRLQRQLKIKSKRGNKLAAVINAHGGRGYGHMCVWLARKTSLNIAQVAALLEKESGFQNVYGHDPVRNPIKSPARGMRAVTKRNYRLYKAARKAGLGMQGVGPVQLTWYEFQDQADKLGGCWIPRYSCLVGCRTLADNIRAKGGQWAGARAYNGAGAAAMKYANDYSELVDRWHDRFRAAGL